MSAPLILVAAERLAFLQEYCAHQPFDGLYEIRGSNEHGRDFAVTGGFDIAKYGVDRIQRGCKDLTICGFDKGQWRLVYIQSKGFTPTATLTDIDSFYTILLAEHAATEWPDVQIYLRQELSNGLYLAEFICPLIKRKADIYLTREQLERKRQSTRPDLTYQIMDCINGEAHG